MNGDTNAERCRSSWLHLDLTWFMCKDKISEIDGWMDGWMDK